ncbi:unnamed protein product [Adineta steineri]|nr:unnamed protein product [Adineta steineri]
MNIVNLVNEMLNLQALNVRCEDDTWTNEENLSLSTYDELIEWLRHCLPSSCMVTRDTHDNRDIRLWIK